MNLSEAAAWLDTSARLLNLTVAMVIVIVLFTKDFNLFQTLVLMALVFILMEVTVD